METYATERSHVHPITQSQLVSTLRGSTEKKMSNKLKDKIAPITGDTEGIGLATTKLFAEEGICLYHGLSPEGTRRGREGNRHQRCGTWDVLQDEATRDESQSGSPVFGAMFPA